MVDNLHDDFIEDSSNDDFEDVFNDSSYQIGYDDLKENLHLNFNLDVQEIDERALEKFLNTRLGRKYSEMLRDEEIKNIEKGLY